MVSCKKLLLSYKRLKTHSPIPPFQRRRKRSNFAYLKLLYPVGINDFSFGTVMQRYIKVAFKLDLNAKKLLITRPQKSCTRGKFSARPSLAIFTSVRI